MSAATFEGSEPNKRERFDGEHLTAQVPPNIAEVKTAGSLALLRPFFPRRESPSIAGRNPGAGENTIKTLSSNQFLKPLPPSQAARRVKFAREGKLGGTRRGSAGRAATLESI